MVERFAIAGYARISVDEELDRDNTSIENQKAIITEFVKTKFPDSELTFFEDRDKSGYTFEQRTGYQIMRRQMMAHQIDILVVKDFSRFSRRNSRGLVELEDLRDAGVRIISIGDNVDYPNDDDWLKIQFQFLINEMPVTDASKKVRAVVKRRQEDGKWICAAPYGYIVNSRQEFELVPTEADIVRKIFQLYIDGWGYKRIANHLTDEHIPTPRMEERARAEAQGKEYRRATKPVWAIVTVQGILSNDFYIGTLRQGKYFRRKINGKDVRRDADEHIVIENHHQPIIDYRTFATARALMEKRTTSDYRGVKKYENNYTGFLRCGACGSPMFTMSKPSGQDSYRCGLYHRRGLKGCTSHFVKAATLDQVLKMYLHKVRDTSQAMLERLNADIAKQDDDLEETELSAAHLTEVLESLQEELKATKRQRIRDLMKHPEQEALLEKTYDEMETDLANRIAGLQFQIEQTEDKRNLMIRVNRKAKTALEIFDEILDKDHLDSRDLNLIVDQIIVFEDHIDVKLKADIDTLLRTGTLPETVEEAVNFNSGTECQIAIVQKSAKQPDKAFRVNVVSEGDPLEIYTDRDGEVILKKYSPIGEMSSFAKDYTESLFRSLGHIAVIVDRDQVVAASGLPRKELGDKPISRALETAIASRQTVALNQQSGGRMVAVTTEEDQNPNYTAQVISPIIADGEAIGAVLLMSRDNGVKMGDTELKVAETAAGIVGRQMEQ